MTGQKVCLDVGKLGGVQNFRVISQNEFCRTKTRYVCSTFKGDEADNDENADIHQICATGEYVALIEAGT